MMRPFDEKPEPSLEGASTEAETGVLGAPADHPAIFISYRRSNALTVHHIYEKMCARLKSSHIFLDRRDITLGAVFPDTLRQAVTHAKFLLVIIGRDWASMQNERTFCRRLDEPEDWVRQEISLSLTGGATVIPVLVEGANLPTHEQLPALLRPLLSCNSKTLSIERFGEDAQELIDFLAKNLPPSHARAANPGAPGLYCGAADLLPQPVPPAELDLALKSLPHWNVVESDVTDDPRMPLGYRRSELVREFIFDSFEDAIAFMYKTMPGIAVRDHHPRWQNVFKTVIVGYSTWDIGHRPSDRDLENAQWIEKQYVQFMTKHPASDSGSQIL